MCLFLRISRFSVVVIVEVYGAGFFLSWEGYKRDAADASEWMWLKENTSLTMSLLNSNRTQRQGQ